MLPFAAQPQTVEWPGSFYYLAALVGFSALVAMRKPKTVADFAEMFAFGMSGLLLMSLCIGWINTHGSAGVKATAADPYTRAGAVGVFIAFGGSLWVLLWKLLEKTSMDLEGMNLFEAVAFIVSRGKTRPRKARKIHD